MEASLTVRRSSTLDYHSYHENHTMIATKLLLSWALLSAATSAALLPGYPGAVRPGVDFDPNPQYTFSYSVNDAYTGDSKSQEETRNGDTVRGSYTVLEADGRLRTVHYTADAVNGFNAVVEYSGVKNVAVTRPKPAYAAPTYVAPVQTYVPAPAVYQPPRPTFTQAKPVYAQPAYKPTHSFAGATSGVHTSFSAPHANYAY